MTGNKRKGGRKRGLVVQDRDLLLLEQLWVMHAADRDQLMVAAGFGSVTRVNTRLLALTRAGLLRRFFIGSGKAARKAVYALSAKGAQLINVQARGPRRKQDELLIADFSILHQLAINTVYCLLRFQPISDPNVHFARWEGFTERISKELRLIPDGYVEFATQKGTDAAFIEVDLGHERLTVWKEKAERYLQLALSGEFTRSFMHPRFRVLVLATSERRAQSIRKAVASVTEKIFWFAPFHVVHEGNFFESVWLRPVGNQCQPLFEKTL
jgi:hypothetical protein